MKIFLLIPIFLFISLSMLKSKDTLKTYAKPIEIITPSEANAIGQIPEIALTEISARFQEGDLEKFRDWVQKNLVYPPLAVENGIQGMLWVQFDINSKGKLVDPKILRGVDQILDNEVLRVINSSPEWEPALLDGKPVKQQFTMPVIFELVSRRKRR